MAFPTPSDLKSSAISAARSKCARPLARTFFLAVLAGVYIGMGGMFMLVVKADSELSFAVSALLSGLVFCLGLLSVMVAGAELFTGNCLMALASWSHEIELVDLLKQGAVVWIGNFCGAAILAALVAASGFADLSSGAVGAAAVTVATAKASLPALVIFIKALLCNFLVCLAVWMGFAASTVVDKFFAAFLPVAAFVATGFEHCVANMFFMPLGWLASAGSLDLAAAGLNIVVATLGNVVGGAILFAGLYWLSLERS